MKNLYALLFSLAVLGIHQLTAQNLPSAGFRAGVTVSSLQGDAVKNLNDLVDLTNGMVTTTPRTGFHAGAFARIPAGEFISVEPGLYYSQKGYTMKGDFGIKALDFIGANASAELQSTYIDLPVLLRVNLVKGLQVFAGPQVSYLAKNNLQVKAGALGFSLFNRDIDVTDQFSRWDVALTGGLSYQFNNGLSLQAGYDYGLSKVDANSNFRSYNSAVKVGLGFNF
jgi:hypothetical protein